MFQRQKFAISFQFPRQRYTFLKFRIIFSCVSLCEIDHEKQSDRKRKIKIEKKKIALCSQISVKKLKEREKQRKKEKRLSLSECRL